MQGSARTRRGATGLYALRTPNPRSGFGQSYDPSRKNIVSLAGRTRSRRDAARLGDAAPTDRITSTARKWQRGSCGCDKWRDLAPALLDGASRPLGRGLLAA
jgi:hypothetical protein